MSDYARFVETILPQSWLYELGVYLQTCAQIEFFTCSAICKIEGLDETSPNWRIRHDELRNMSMADLIKQLRSAEHVLEKHDPWRPYFKELRSWMHRYVDNRHIATHGRHSQSQFLDKVVIDAAPRGSRTTRIYEVSHDDAVITISNADQILQALIRFNK